MQLDRRAKGALALLALILAVMLVLTVRTSIVAVTGEELVAAPNPESQDEILEIGGTTLLLKHGSASNRIAHWAHASSKSARAFEVGERSFASTSDALTDEGQRRIDAFGEMLNHARALHARIVPSTYKADPRLIQLRAERLRSALVREGVAASRISISNDPIKDDSALSGRPELIVVLSK
jgi:hypothetical protein